MNVSDILGKLNFRKKPPVADPLAYAREKYGQDFTEVLRVERWKDEVVSCTTGRFEKLGKGYVRHCGPTAITNLILTLNHRGQYFEMQKPGDRGRESAGAEKNAAAGHTPEEIFLRVCAIGKRSLMYWNTDILHSMGGTYDILAGRFIRKSLAEFLPALSDRLLVRRHISAGGSECVRQLQNGALLYLLMHRHPCYGNHHVLCCGAVVLRGVQRPDEKIFLLIADGWSHQLRYVDAGELGLLHFYSIEVSKNE